MEVNSTIILSVAALAITWCSYQSTLWNGIQAFRLASASTHSRSALQQTLVIGQHQAIDAAIIVNFMNAVVDGNQGRVNYYMERARPAMKSILNDWIATDPVHNRNAPAHPLLMPAYKLSIDSAFNSVGSSKNKADQLWKEAERANAHGDKYVLLTVLLSIVMFLGAIAPKLEFLKLAIILNLTSVIICTIVLCLLFFYMPPAPSN